jgi:hypothetical protein
MSLEHFSRLSQSIKDSAVEHADAAKAQKAATLVVNSVGSMVQPKRTARPSELAEATDVIGNAIKTAREAKLARARDNKATETAKTLAELLAESAQDSE